MISSLVTSPDKMTVGNNDHWLLLFYSLQQHCHVDREVFNELHTFIAPPPELKSFSTIAANLIRILSSIKAILAFEPQPDRDLRKKLSLWISYSESLVSIQKDIEIVIPNFCEKGKFPSHPPQHGSYDSHPLFVALWCSVTEPALSERYVLLQAYLCLAYYYLRPLEDKKGYRYENSKHGACRAVRKLSNPHYANILLGLPSEAQQFNDYLDSFKALVGDKDFPSIALLFSSCLKGKKGRTHSRKSIRILKNSYHENQFNEKSQNYSIKDDEEDGSLGETAKTHTVQTGDKREIEARKKALCSPDEFTSARESITIEEEGSDPSGGRDIQQQVYYAKANVSAIAMNNQRIITDWDRLTPYEIAIFLQEIDYLSRKGCEDFSGIPSSELAAFLAVVFWSSTTVKEVQECTLVPAVARSAVQLSIQWAEGESGYWVIKPRVAKQTIVPSTLLKKQALPPAPRYSLPIPSECLDIIEPHLATIQAQYAPTTIFNLKSDYVSAANKFLKVMRRNFGGRQSLQRLSVHIHDLIARIPGSDVTVAMAITGRNDSLGAVPLHYTANGLQRIKDIYSLACSMVLVEAGDDSNKELIEIAECRPNDDEWHVGSSFVPRQKTVTDFIEDLRKRIQETRKNIGNFKKLPVQFHNDITVYTIMMLGFATGYRAVHDPLLQEAELDRQTGFAVISDKDNEDFYNSRMVWLPEFCLKQLEYYNKHLAILQKMLFRQNQELFFKVRQKAVTGRQSTRYNPSLFILEDDCNDLPVQPKVLKLQITNAGYFLPVNSNRHYLRTNLLSLGCKIEIINAFMGHWERGVEPWGCYSGLSPFVYRDELIKYLVPMLQADGWEEEEGLGILGNG